MNLSVIIPVLTFIFFFVPSDILNRIIVLGIFFSQRRKIKKRLNACIFNYQYTLNNKEYINLNYRVGNLMAKVYAEKVKTPFALEFLLNCAVWFYLYVTYLIPFILKHA